MYVIYKLDWGKPLHYANWNVARVYQRWSEVADFLCEITDKLEECDVGLFEPDEMPYPDLHNCELVVRASGAVEWGRTYEEQFFCVYHEPYARLDFDEDEEALDLNRLVFSDETRIMNMYCPGSLYHNERVSVDQSNSWYIGALRE